MRSVRIRTPARLHFGLFADGRGARKFGGVGMAIDKPGFELTVRFDEMDHIYSWIDSSLHGRISKLLATLRSHFDVPPVRIDVEESIPHHVGLGSGTQLALAVGEAVARLIRLQIPRDEYALILGRGKRSGIGFHAFYDGGFIIDPGKTQDRQIAQAAFQSRFPEDWRVVLIQPPVEPGLHGQRELEAFQDRIVIRSDTAERLFKIALEELAPALVAKDFAAFSEALFEINRRSGECFAEVQGGVYAHPRLHVIVDDSRKLGCRGVGQSSWGPTLFAMQPSDEAAAEFVERLAELHPEVELTIASGKRQYGPAVPCLGTQLLVSVRSAAETREALAGGIDIIDVKEPNHGPLGRAEAEARNEVVDLLFPLRREQLREQMLGRSIALGELSQVERCSRLNDGVFNAAPGEVGNSGPVWVKVGFAGERTRSDWSQRFLNLPSKTFAHRNWELYSEFIPAAYADDEVAQSPHWRDIVDRIVLKKKDWRRLLVDTFSKTHSFWNALGGKEGVRELFIVCKKEKINLALAGSLKIDDLDRLADEIGELPAVVAVRGAVCKDGIRTNPIDRERVAEFRRRLIAVETRLGRNRPSCG